MRQDLKLNTFEEVITECDRLLQSGYDMSGKWTLAQMCHHVRLTMESNMHGYPRWMTTLGLPLRPFLRKFALPRLLAGNSIKGVKTAGMFVPPSGLDDTNEVHMLKACIQKFDSHSQALHAHPGFGRMSHEEFARFHAAHAAHHLAFLTPSDQEDEVRDVTDQNDDRP